jgi:2-desacetyl-2-hydroxyethyl bacteriochlorophyllide A dehydrogenase
MTDVTTAVILEGPGRLAVRQIEVPPVPEPSARVALGACGICGSDVRYYRGENPWAMHTLGYHVDSPPNMVLGHEVSGTRTDDGRRVAILAYKACGRCPACVAGHENLCEEMEHFGHSAGWGVRNYYPGGMSEVFDIWEEFAYPIPDSVSFEAGTFLDGLAVAIHAVDMAEIESGNTVGIVGLGPIGMLAAQVAQSRGAAVAGCDTGTVPVRLAGAVGIDQAIHGSASALRGPFDAIIDTVGTDRSIVEGLQSLAKRGRLVLLAVHPDPVPLPLTSLSGERRILTSANNRYADFPRAIELLGSGAVTVEPLVTHRFPLERAQEAFDVMLAKEDRGAFKVVLVP